jgi:hypothetical protein
VERSDCGPAYRALCRKQQFAHWCVHLWQHYESDLGRLRL